MAWYNSLYVCPECGAVWDSDWSCCSEDECPECDAGDISPVSSEDLTIALEPNGNGSWTIWHSPSHAEDKPRYVMVGGLMLTKSGAINFVTQVKAK